MTIKYTTKERAVVSDAWAQLLQFASCNYAGDEVQLAAALRAERKEVSETVVAKALLLRTLVDALDTRGDCAVTVLSDLWTIRSAHRDLVAYAHHYADGLRESGLLEVARTAAAAHSDAFRRALEEL